MNFLQGGLVRLIRGYQRRISPLSGPQCRFVPSCSEYAREAIESYGAVRGLLMGAGRLVRCHPWQAGGVDPVPAASPKAEVHH